MNMTGPKRVVFFLTIYNEAEAIPQLLENLSQAKLPPGVLYSIYAVDDASTDKTPQVLKAAKEKYPLTVLRYEKNRGIPTTFKEAFEYFVRELSDDDAVILMEADGTSDPKLIPHMLEKIGEGNDIVIASRYRKGSASIGFPWHRLQGSKLVNLFLRLMWSIDGVSDYSIFYRAYRMGFVKKCFGSKPIPMRAKRSFAANAELLLLLSDCKPKIAEVPLRYDYSLKRGPSRMKLFSTLKEYVRITRFPLIHRQPIFWIAVGAFALRLWGIMYGFPDLLVLDEPALTRGALTMLQLKTLIPAFYPEQFAAIYYPPFTSYLYLIVLAPLMGISYLFSGLSSVQEFGVRLILDPTEPWLATRAVSAFFGALTVYALGRLGERLYPGSGIYVALFAATSFLFLTFSHIARHWSLSVLLFVGMLFAAYYIFHAGKKRWYILGGLFGGLGLGTGIVTAAFFIVPLFAHFARPESWRVKFLAPYLWVMGSVAIVVGLYFALVDPHTVVDHLFGTDSQDNTYREPKSLLAAAEMFTVAMRDLVRSETVLFLCALMGIPAILRRHRVFGGVLVLSVFTLLSLVYIGYYYLLHYTLPILPILVLFAGVGAYEIVSLAKTRFAKVLLAIGIFLLPTAIALQFSYLWTQPDTRHDARAYIEENIPSDARIITYMPNMKVVWPIPASLNDRIAFDAESGRLVDRTLLGLSTSTYPMPHWYSFELGTLSPEGRAKVTAQWLRAQNFDYAVIDKSATPILALDALASGGEIIAHFPLSGESINILDNDYGGPTLDVFKLRQLGPEVLIVKLSK